MASASKVRSKLDENGIEMLISTCSFDLSIIQKGGPIKVQMGRFGFLYAPILWNRRLSRVGRLSRAVTLMMIFMSSIVRRIINYVIPVFIVRVKQKWPMEKF